MGRLSVAVISTISAAAFSHIASAADLPMKTPVKAPDAVVTNWTGVYVNGGFGYGLWSADTTTVNPSTGACLLCVTQTQGGKGWLGVVGIGYDYQFASNFVAGVFGDVNFGRLKGTIQDQGPFFAGETKEEWAWAAGARVGWLMTPEALIYVNGGYTSARFSGANMVNTFVGASTGFSTPGVTTHGGFVGIGTEYALAGTLGLGPGWFWRNEYRYASYGSKSLTDTNGAGAQANITFKPVVQTVTSEIVYKLNTGGPSYAAAPLPPANWSGFYINGGIGYGGWVADTTTVNPTTGLCILCIVQKQGGKGWLGVAGVGFDYQIMPRIVAGVFGDFDFSSLKGTIQDQGPFFVGSIKQEDAWAVGARAGWLVTPRLLTYWNVGYSSARFSGTNMVFSFNGSPTGFTTPGTTFNGWFAGGGLEAPIMPNLFWRTEYRYASYDSKSLSDTNGTGIGLAANITFKPVVQTVTTQLLYKFNWWR